MGKVAKLKTLIEIFAKNDGSVKSELGKTSKQIDDLRKKAAETSIMPDIKSGNGADNAMQQAAQRASSVTQKIKALGESVRSAGYKMQSLGTKLMPASLGAQGLITASVKMANDFDNGMAKVNTIAGLSDDKLSALSKSLLRVSSQTGQSATDIAEAAYQSLSASVPTDQVAKFTKTAANLAKTGFTDTASAVDVLSTAINAYGLKTSETSKLSDMLIQTQNRGKITVNELAAQMGNVIPTASALGVNMANLSTGYVQLTKQGINAAASTTELRAMFNELSKSGSGVSKVLKKQTGKDFTTLMKSGKSLGDVMQILGNSVKGNKTEFKNLWSNSRAGAGALALLNAGSKDFNKQLGDMNNSTGNVSKALNNLNTRGAKSKKAINELKNSGIELGETFMDAASPAINTVTKSIGGLTDKFSKLPQSEKNAVAGATALVAIASPVLIGVGKVVSGLGNMIIKTTTAVGKLIEIFPKGVSAIKGFATGAEGTTASAIELATGLSGLGPVALTAGAAIASVTALMVLNRKSYSSSADALDKYTDKTQSVIDTSKNLTQASQSHTKAYEGEISKANENAQTAQRLAQNVESLASVEHKSASQKEDLRIAVEALNRVVPGLNLQYDAQKDKLSKVNSKIQENIALVRQQAIQKAINAENKKKNNDLVKESIQSTKEQQQIYMQQSKMVETTKALADAKAKLNEIGVKYGIDSTEYANQNKVVLQLAGSLATATTKLGRLKSQHKATTDKMKADQKEISENTFDGAVTQAQAAGQKIPTSLQNGIKSAMSALPQTVGELKNAMKYDDVIKKANDAGVKIPTALSQKIVTGKVTVKKAESQINSVIKFDGAVKKAKKQGVKIPKSLSSGVDSGKITAKQASDRLAQVVKFDKAVKKAKKQGSKTAKNLAASIASGKMTAQQASAKLGNASTSKLDKSKDAKSKGTKTNKSFSNGVGQTSAPRAAGQRASNAGVAPFKKVPNRVGTALAGLSAKIRDAFTFKIPHIPIPHPGVTGHFDLKKGTVPHFSMNWYKNGGIMTRPTVFGASGNKLLAGGEAGPEGIIPLNKLWKNMDRAIAYTVNKNVKNIYSDAGPLAQASTSNKTVNVNNYNNYNNYYNNYTKNYNSNARKYNSDSSFAKNALDKSISMISTIANIAKLASVVTAPVTKMLDKRQSKSNVVKIIDVKRGEMPRPVSFKNDDSLKGKNLTNILKTGSLSFDLGATPQEMSSNITTNAKSRSVSNNYSSARSIANSRANSKSKSINISGVTFAPNIVIKGSAKKQDIIDALKEVEDEFKDYLKEITDDEEESYYA